MSNSTLLGWAVSILIIGNCALTPVNAASYIPQIAQASDEGELAMKRFQLPKGFKVELFAAEPHLANPVAFCVDEKGRFYVCETFRLGAGVTDIRGKDDWLDEDLAARTVNDRLALMKRHLGARISEFAIQPDRLKLIEDRDGDGKADHSTVFADGFNDPLDGIAAGVLARKGDVWFANLPNLWRLRDTNADGVADTRESLHHGYGVRIGFLGHDLHGLRFGPDGKLYFTIGDRGSHIEQDGKIVGHPDTGCVFRCNPDGSELEVFAFGLRNPQELAFDEYGNLFTGDNNSDGGDRARFVHVVEGGDSGWRIGYQFIRSPNPRGPWNSEKLWHPQWLGQAAHLVPPIVNLADGPSGLAYYPGTGMPDRYAGHFFLCDFHGGKGSGIHSFALKPKGASFELVDRQNFLWEGLPTDVDFGVEGGIYYTDWVQGWGKTGKGRIYRVFDPESVKKPIVSETKKLLGEGMDRREIDELVRLLGHADMRVRQEAQFALADKGASTLPALVEVAQKSSHRLARLHAIWGIAQIAIRSNRSSPVALSALPALRTLVSDRDDEVRAQAAKVLGDCRELEAFQDLVRLVYDASPRVRFFAAMGLGKLRQKRGVEPILDLLRTNADVDPLLRHAAVMALTWINDMDSLLAAAQHNSPAVRMGVLLALRRLERPEILEFLTDSEPALIEEAARAINDQPINGAMQELAELIARPGLSQPTLRRVLNANFRVGTPDTALALAQFAKRYGAAAELRAEALAALGDWAHPSGRDRVIGVWRPIPATRSLKTAQDALKPVWSEILRTAPDAVRIAAIQAGEKLELEDAGSILVELVYDAQLSSGVRAASLQAIAASRHARLSEVLRFAAADKDEKLRGVAVKLQARIQPADAVPQLLSALNQGSIAEQQGAFTTLATLKLDRADEIIASWMDRMLAGQVRQELHLDLWSAATNRTAASIRQKLSEYESRWPKNDPLAPYRPALQGGDAREGRRVFFEKAEAGCLRCHKINGEGGEVGPDLAGIGTRQNREYILEAMLFPNKQIAAGYESVVITLSNGVTYTGTLKSENDIELVVNSPEDGLVSVKKAEVKARNRGVSAMPEGMETLLSKHELRDLIEFLASPR